MLHYFYCSVQFSSVAQSCLTLCDPMDCSTPGLHVHHQLLEFIQTHVHWVGDAIRFSAVSIFLLYSKVIQLWELDYKESWALKNWCFWTVVLEKTLESPLDCKEIQPIHPKGDKSWVFIGRTEVEAETPILWPPDAKSWLIGKDLDAGKDWRQEEKGTTEDEMAGWHHRLDGCESKWTLGVGNGQRGLACCGSWGRKEWDTTERLNWTELTFFFIFFSITVGHRIVNRVSCAAEKGLVVYPPYM